MDALLGNQKLRDEVFCLTQERDFFQSKYLEQVSVIQEMKKNAARSRKEIDRLRQELMRTKLKAQSLDEEDGTISNTGSSVVDDELEVIRNNASKLLVWADYRQTRVTEKETDKERATSPTSTAEDSQDSNESVKEALGDETGQTEGPN